MPNIGATELLIVFAIVLVVFGAGKLPRIMGDIGKGIKEFRHSIAEIEEANEEIDEGISQAKKAIRNV